MLKPAYRRKIWVVVDEQTEHAMFNQHPDIFLLTSPEFVLTTKEAEMEENNLYQKLVQVIRSAIATLPEDYQAVIYLRYFNDSVDAYTSKEIADKLGISVRTYYNRLNAAKALLHEQLESSPIVAEYLQTNVID